MISDRKRIYQLDLIRVIACLMVVLMHSPLPSENANGSFLGIISYATAPCICLFFMVSGALLLPVKGSTSSFLKRRLGKIIGPTLVWSLIYIGYNHYQGTDHSWGGGNIVSTILRTRSWCDVVYVHLNWIIPDCSYSE